MLQITKSTIVATILGAMTSSLPTYGQETLPVPAASKKSETIDVRPGGELRGALGKSEQRQKLMEEIQRLVVHMGVKEQALQKLREGHDGTPGSFLKVVLLDIEVTADQGPLLSALAGTLDDLSAEVKADKAEKKSLKQQRETQATDSQSNIEQLGSKILAGKTTKGEPLTEEDLDDLRALLHQKILQRNERQADAKRYAQDLADAETELKDLAKLDQRLEGINKVQQAYLERLLDSVENTREGFVRDEVVGMRKQLQEVVAVMEGRIKKTPQPPAIEPDKGTRRGVQVGDLAKQLKTELSPEDQKRVDDELESLRKRQSEKKATTK
jgi:hypothetical protein